MQHLIATYGLLAVWVLMAAESACIPVPSEATMLFGGALAAGAVSGAHPSLAAVIVAGTLGNVVGSYLAWLMGKYGGRPGLRRWGRYVGLRSQEIDKAQDWFDRCGASVVFWSRLLPGIRTFISLPAGIAEMPAARFGLYTAAGCSAVDRGASHRRIRHRRGLAGDRTRDAPSQPRHRGGGLRGDRHLGLTRHST